MAIGLTPKYSSLYPLAGQSPADFLILAMEAMARLNWQVRYISHSGIVALATTYPAQITLQINEQHAVVISSSLRTELFDRGRNKANVAAIMSAMDELKPLIEEAYYHARYEQLQPYLPLPEADVLLHPRPHARSQLGDIMAIFKPAAGYFVTPILLNINLLVFLLMALSGVSMLTPDSSSLIHWGANYGSLTWNGEWWRLLTACFVHIGAFHLFMNMYAFLLIGAQLEPRLGITRFFSAYILTGIIASITSLLVHDYTISAGASGAIFGMYGVFLALLSTSLVEKSNRRQLLASILFFVGYNLLNGLKPGIDNAAHMGGLVSGLLIGYCFVPGLKKMAAQQAQALPPTNYEEQPADYY
jgi:rhomboid protease GluP